LSIHNGIEWDPIKKGKGSQQTTAGAVLRPGSGDVSASATDENDDIDQSKTKRWLLHWMVDAQLQTDKANDRSRYMHVPGPRSALLLPGETNNVRRDGRAYVISLLGSSEGAQTN
jgi:hypothetical protein